MIKIEHITKAYGKEAVLHDVSISIRPGVFTGLIGASGSGKSTLARCIVGLECFDSGSVSLGGVEFSSATGIFDSTRVAARRKMILVLQGTVLQPYRTVIEHIVEGLCYVDGLKYPAAVARATPWIARFGLSDHLNKFPAEISGGQLARVALLRAAVMEPEYIICDELTANLDPLLAADVGKALLELTRTGIGVLAITHQLEFLRRHADEVHFLANGIIRWSGPAAKTFSEPHDPVLQTFLSQMRQGQ